MATAEVIPAAQTETRALAVVPSTEAALFMPVMTIAKAIERETIMEQIVNQLMKEAKQTESGEFDGDYGIIPGTKTKTLLLPGAQKLDVIFGLTTQFIEEIRIEDLTGENHGGIPYFYVKYKCQCWRGDRLISEGVGSCNSWESKYRWRDMQRKCPTCGKENIRKSNKDDTWYCWKKTGGCGAQFDAEDPEITSQKVGKADNSENIADYINAIEKIAAKRSHIAATENGTAASRFFKADPGEFPMARRKGSAASAPPDMEEPPDMGDVPPDEPPVTTKKAAPQQSKTRTESAGTQKKLTEEEIQTSSEKDEQVLALWSRLGNNPGMFMSCLKQFKAEMREMSGADKWFEDVLWKNTGMDEITEAQLRKAGLVPARYAIREMFLARREWKEKNTPPPADGQQDFIKTLQEKVNNGTTKAD